MLEEPKEKLRLEIAHVLFIDIVGYSTRLTDEQQALVDQLNQVARSSDEFQKATATGRLMKIRPATEWHSSFITVPSSRSSAPWKSAAF
jgi:hypothetical protein